MAKLKLIETNHDEKYKASNLRLHECSICGKVDTWGESWMWFGSIAQEDEGLPVVKVCSQKCKEEYERENNG